MSELKAFDIQKFLGVNKSTTETLLELGEASHSSNWMITEDYKLKKMFGYAKTFNPLNSPIKGIWYGTLNGTAHLLFACGGHVYEHNLSTHANVDLGTLADAVTTFFAINNTIYILNGTELYSWTSGSISTVTGYTPTVCTATPPSGGGTLLEGINYISGQKAQKFSSTGSATVYKLLEYDIDSVDSVYINGVLQTVTTDYTVDLTNGSITFVAAPVAGTNDTVITWTKVTSGDRDLITKNFYYGGMYYSRLWLFGNPDHKNTRFVSGVTIAGVSDPTYWPMYADSDVGEYEITDICVQYNKQLIFTSGDSSGASAWYSESETYTDPSTGIITTLFPVFPMNSKVGNIAKGQTQIIFNDPFTVYKGVFKWVSTYVQSEKNAEWISKRVQNDLDLVDLSSAVTWDWDDKGIYILSVGTKVWCYNYRIDVWYVLDLPHTPTCFTTIDSELYFGTSTGTIMKFDESLGTYDGATISASWEMGYFNFGVDWLTKFVQKMYASILPLTTTHIDIYVSTDKKASFELVKTISYSLSSFETWDFSDFSFETNYSPQPFKIKLRAKKIDYLKIKLVNDGADSAVALSLTFPTRTGGEVKQKE